MQTSNRGQYGSPPGSCETRVRLGRAAALIFLILAGIGIWFRVSSLGDLPEINSDEAWYGIQASRLLAGQPFAFKTYTESPINPFYTLLYVPLLLFSDPQPWIVRAPSAFCGVLAVILAATLLSRALDRTTGLITAFLLAVLPAAIGFARTGIDASQIPLCGVLIVYFAIRARTVALGVTVLASLVVHPTNVFIVAFCIPVYLVQKWRGFEGDRVRQWRLLIATAGVTGLGLALVGWWTLRRDWVRYVYNDLSGQGLDWWTYFRVYGDFFFADFGEPRAVHGHRVFWPIFLVALILGGWRLVKQRRWERLSLVGGFVALFVGFHVVAGFESYFGGELSIRRRPNSPDRPDLRLPRSPADCCTDERLATGMLWSPNRRLRLRRPRVAVDLRCELVADSRCDDRPAGVDLDAPKRCERP